MRFPLSMILRAGVGAILVWGGRSGPAQQIRRRLFIAPGYLNWGAKPISGRSRTRASIEKIRDS